MNKSIKSLSIPQKSLKKLVGLPADNLYKEGFPYKHTARHELES